MRVLLEIQSHSDAELLELINQNDDSAFTLLLNKY